MPAALPRNPRHPGLRRVAPAALGCLFAATVMAGGPLLAAPPRPAASQTVAPQSSDAGVTAVALVPPVRDMATVQVVFDAVDARRYDDARALTAGLKLRPLDDFVEWSELQDGRVSADYQRLYGFAAAHPEWPRVSRIMARAETVLPAGWTPAQVIDWFGDAAPRTAEGAIRLIDALRATGRDTQARKIAVGVWDSMVMNERQQSALLLSAAGLLSEADHRRRLDIMLWRGQDGAARMAMPLVDPSSRALAEARLAMNAGSPKAAGLIAALPDALRSDPGLTYSQARAARRAGDLDQAARLIRAATRVGAVELSPGDWWLERHIVTRMLLERGDAQAAYDLVSTHEQTDAVGFSEAEWLAGWIALRALNQPQAALTHFTAMYERVSRPISRARAAYWAGRAASRLGDTQAAQAWLMEAARDRTTFYGQIAAERIDLPTTLASFAAPNEARAPEEAMAALSGRPLAVMVALISRTDEQALLSTFAYALADTLARPDEQHAFVEAVRGLARPDLALRFAKRFAEIDDRLAVELRYPAVGDDAGVAPGVAGDPQPDHLVDFALVHAIARQESEFNPRAVSRAGAVGLMQLMPGTARNTAGQVALAYQPERLTDPLYNMTLGRAYLGRMIERYRGNLVLAVASYNAGPGKVDEWIGRYGDPRDPSVDVIDWIEKIPYGETRNYVQRVLEALTVYRHRLGRPDPGLVPTLALGIAARGYDAAMLDRSQIRD
ncbi:lytic transglycosylase domain-containing protein [Tistrella bauzanensis]|uniref:lytic transglycosylase domain-containing protein n=1 Tax=Tistrella TaxID=171436 RepID=UPI0031F61BD3